MSLLKNEYQALLTLLDRVETKGLVEAKSLLILEQKLQDRVANWYDGHVTGFKQELGVIEPEVKSETEKLL